mmetsp:Transcript_8220/g.22906  ORF Transcript_8220/g.22906 Transcript_8220/m.22906 type:complete len:283 (-) Transcript_8220:38-886(-)
MTVHGTACSPRKQIHQQRDEANLLHERCAGPGGGRIGIRRTVAGVEQGQGGIPRRVVPRSITSTICSGSWAGTSDQYLLIHLQHAHASQLSQWVVGNAIIAVARTTREAVQSQHHPDRVGVPDQILDGSQHLRGGSDGVDECGIFWHAWHGGCVIIGTVCASARAPPPVSSNGTGGGSSGGSGGIIVVVIVVVIGIGIGSAPGAAGRLVVFLFVCRIAGTTATTASARQRVRMRRRLPHQDRVQGRRGRLDVRQQQLAGGGSATVEGGKAKVGRLDLVVPLL